MIALQVSLYPLGEENIEKHLNKFWQELKTEKINYRITPLSTVAWSADEEKLYSLVFKAFKKVREECRVVMVSTLTTGTEDDIKMLLKFLDS